MNYQTDSIEDNADGCYDRAAKLFDDNPPLALKELEMALVFEPHHVQALILAGELYLFQYQSLAINDDEANVRALSFFEQALSHEPQHADAWSGKALALFYQENNETAIQAANRGLAVLPLAVGFGMQQAEISGNVGEALHNVKVKALLALGRRYQARQALAAGLTEYPNSKLLTRRVEEFL